MGGAIRQHGKDEAAFSGRDAEFTININCGTTDPDLLRDASHVVREWLGALSPHSTGGMYVNFISEDSGDRVREVYGESKYRRLAEIKSRYDPNNVLRVNQNIKPASARSQ